MPEQIASVREQDSAHPRLSNSVMKKIKVITTAYQFGAYQFTNIRLQRNLCRVRLHRMDRPDWDKERAGLTVTHKREGAEMEADLTVPSGLSRISATHQRP